MRALPMFWMSCAAVLLAACGGNDAAPRRSDPFAALAAEGSRVRPLAVAAPAVVATRSSYDFATGQLVLQQLQLAGSSSCYDAVLKTVQTAPIRLQLDSVAGAPCAAAGIAVARYDAAAQQLSVPTLSVAGGSCYDVTLQLGTPDPMRFDLVTATAAACPTASKLVLSSPAAAEGGTLPTEHSCDGPGSSPPLAWSGAPAGTNSYALLMTTLPGDGSTKWNWVLWDIPAAASGLAKDSFGIGTAGVGSDGPFAGYQTPCSQGPGAKRYTWTLYALSAAPVFTVSPEKVTGAMLAQAIAPLTLGSASLNLNYSRTANAPGSSTGCGYVRASLAGASPVRATVNCDSQYAYVGGDGLAAHAMMDGITATNLQVPVAQAFFGANAWKIPLNPAIAANTVSAVDGPIGVAINGVPIFNPCKQGGCQNGDTKVLGELDVCNGHAGRADDYHYHAAPVCLMAGKPAAYWDTHPVGWALDGYAIFGYRNADGSTAPRDGLCGGNTSPAPNAPAGYAYHVTDASPYVLSCFRGTPSPDLASQAAKYAPLRKPPVTPFAVSGMTLSSSTADGYQVLQFDSARSFTTTSNGNDSYAYAPGRYQVRYQRVAGAELIAMLALPANRNKTACWNFQFNNGSGSASQPPVSYCR